MKKRNLRKKTAGKVEKTISNKMGKPLSKRILKKLAKKSAKLVALKSSKKTSERIASGIPNFDKLVQGGFEQGTTNLLVGGSGSGKTIFATQFLMAGVKKGEKCLYITFEESKDQFYKNMKKFGWDLETYEKKELFHFLEYSPEKVKTMLEEGGGIIESLVLTKKITRIVIDSITSFALLFEDELEKRESSLELFALLKKWECTTLLTFEEEPMMNKTPAASAMEFESDSIIMLYFIRDGRKSRERYIEVLKMRGTNHSKEVHAFNMSKGGLIINSRPIRTFRHCP